MALVEIRDVHKTFFRGSERIDELLLQHVALVAA